MAMAQSLSSVQLSGVVTLWTIDCQALLSLGLFSNTCTAVGCHFLLQGIFLTQAFPELYVDSLLLSPWESPNY